MTDDEVDELMEDCLEEEDDEGEIPYIRKYLNMKIFTFCTLLLWRIVYKFSFHWFYFFFCLQLSFNVCVKRHLHWSQKRSINIILLSDELSHVPEIYSSIFHQMILFYFIFEMFWRIKILFQESKHFLVWSYHMTFSRILKGKHHPI